jgi:hypothetical protein
VRITWRDVADAERRSLEQHFRLSEARRLQGNEWVYVPLEPTPALLRGLTTQAAVEETDGIDRTAFRLSRRGPLTERRGGLFPGHPNAARAAKLVAFLLIASGLICLVLTSARARASVAYAVIRIRTSPIEATRQAVAAAASWIERGVPVASPAAAGAFRIVFVGLLLALVVSSPTRDIPLDTPGFAEAHGVQRAVVSWLASDRSMVIAVDRTLVISAVFVIAGALTRTSFAVFVAAFFIWACTRTLDTTHHAVSALTWTLPCLLGTPWGRAWSVDAWWRGRRRDDERAAPSRRYGFAIWIPGFVYGVAMLAAAWAKMGAGPDWVLNGTVKYHFVSDLTHAWVSWGPALTKNHLVAVALSAIAIVIEGTLIIASFVRSWSHRLAFGVAAMMLLIGFALFQGLVWQAWWIALVSFLPWQLIGSRAPVPAARAADVRISALQMTAVIASLVQQVIASAARLEVTPMMSAYDMYSTTYASREEYEWSTNLTYRLVALRAGRSLDVQNCVFDDRTVARIEAAPSPTDRLERELRVHGGACLDVGRDVSAVLLEGDRRVFNWETEQFSTRRRVKVVGPIRVSRPH